jgi:hypothetical protein
LNFAPFLTPLSVPDADRYAQGTHPSMSSAKRAVDEFAEHIKIGNIKQKKVEQLENKSAMTV